MLTHEKVVCVGIGAADLEQLHEVMKLPMNITTNSDGAFLHNMVSPLSDERSYHQIRTTGCTLDSSCRTSLA